MTNTERDDSNEEVTIDGLLRPVFRHRRLVAHITVLTTLIVALVGAGYYVLQPIQWTASIGFSPVFAGAADGKYPNGLPFSATDIYDPSVLDQVYDNNHISGYCTRDVFRSGFVVIESSPEMQFLDAEYVNKLADARLTAVDRQRLQDEYKARRESMSVAYQLVFVRPPECARLPRVIALKSLEDVLSTWAKDADLKRGVLKVRGSILTPNIFDFGDTEQESMLVRADLIRTALIRGAENVWAVHNMPGADMVRGGPKQLSFEEIHAKLDDLVKSRLDPLLAVAGGSMGTDSVNWVDQSLKTAVAQAQAAEDRRLAYANALRDYSNGTSTPPTAAGQTGQKPPQGAEPPGGVTAQIDKTFMDRIVELNSANVLFRQELTKKMVDESLKVSQLNATVEHYRQLKTALVGHSSRSPESLAKSLEEIVRQGVDLMKQFNTLYDQYSREALRPAGLMYRVERPAQEVSTRVFTVRSLELLVLGVFLLAPIVTLIIAVVQDRFRRIWQNSRK